MFNFSHLSLGTAGACGESGYDARRFLASEIL